MSYNTSLCGSQMGLSTSIWGCLRFFFRIETNDGHLPILYITKNLAIGTAGSDESRMDKSSNFKLLCFIYYFVLMVLLKTQGPWILPLDLRDKESLLNFFPATANRPRKFLSRCCSMPRIMHRQVSCLLHNMLFVLWAALCELIIRYSGTPALDYVGYLRIQQIEENLERISGIGRIKRCRTHPIANIEFSAHNLQLIHPISSVRFLGCSRCDGNRH